MKNMSTESTPKFCCGTTKVPELPPLWRDALGAAWTKYVNKPMPDQPNPFLAINEL